MPDHSGKDQFSIFFPIFKDYNIVRKFGTIIADNIVRIGPSVTVYWLGGPSMNEILRWDWIFVEARLMKQSLID
jgi:hypothetical protein